MTARSKLPCPGWPFGFNCPNGACDPQLRYPIFGWPLPITYYCKLPTVQDEILHQSQRKQLQVAASYCKCLHLDSCVAPDDADADAGLACVGRDRVQYYSEHDFHASHRWAVISRGEFRVCLSLSHAIYTSLAVERLVLVECLLSRESAMSCAC